MRWGRVTYLPLELHMRIEMGAEFNHGKWGLMRAKGIPSTMLGLVGVGGWLWGGGCVRAGWRWEW